MTDQATIVGGKINTPLFIISGGFIAFFCIVALVSMDGVSKRQSFIVITAVPVLLILLPSFWDALRITMLKGREQ